MFDRLLATVEGLSANRPDLTATDVNKPFQIVRNAQPVLPIMPWKMRITLSTTQTITDSSKSIVNFDTANPLPAYDNTGGFNATTHQFTIPVAGVWVIEVTLAVGIPSSPNSFQNWQAMIFVNAVQTMTGLEQNWLQSAGGNAFNAGAIVGGKPFLNQGDIIDVRFYPNCGGVNSTVVQSTNTSQTVWDMHLLSG